jgi:broad specificity phosphatase PhoE
MHTIYWVRHGENKANITKEFSYKHVDYSLTAKGIQQAQQTARSFLDKNIQAIYTSPLKRAVETAEIIARTLHLDFTLVEEFREINVGTLEGQVPIPELWAFHNRILSDWQNGRHDSMFPGGENYSMLIERVRAGLKRVLSEQNDSNILIVAHGGIITATIKDLCCNPDMEELLRTEKHNCSITELEVDISNEPLAGQLKCWASCAHLYGEAAELVSATPQ